MRAGTSHYSYASSYHDLLSGCKVTKYFNKFQIFWDFFYIFAPFPLANQKTFCTFAIKYMPCYYMKSDNLKQYIDDLNQQYKTGSARSGYRSYRTFSVAFKQRTGQSVTTLIAEQESALQANKD